MGTLQKHIERQSGFTVTCSVQVVCEGEDNEWDGCKTAKDVEREMIADGWLDDFIIEGSLNLACPACVRYCKEHVSSFVELDVRAGGKAKDRRAR